MTKSGSVLPRFAALAAGDAFGNVAMRAPEGTAFRLSSAGQALPSNPVRRDAAPLAAGSSARGLVDDGAGRRPAFTIGDADTDAARRDGPSSIAAPTPGFPVVFDGLFGWLQRGSSRRGVVFCGTLGYEQLLAHRTWRKLEERIVATGCACLRFDYPFEGDSADFGTQRLTDLTDAVRRAVRYMREETGVDEIVLVGLRFGATLAALVAEQEPVDRLVLLAPFVSGRAYLREMALLARTLDVLSDGTPIPHDPGSPIVGGFRLPPGLVEDLAGAKLVQGPLPAPRILLLGPDPSNLAGRYETLGAVVEKGPFPGLTQIVGKALSDETPYDDLAVIARFATEGAAARPIGASSPSDVAAIRGENWVEKPVRFGDGLFGILCEPLQGRADRPAVLFVNSGLNPRAGYGRQTTAMSRRLAELGVCAFRIDQRGVGDSPDRPGDSSPLYARDAIDEVRAAIDHLEGTTSGPIIVVGSCSGAYLAFHTACRDPRVAEVVLLNVYAFEWDHTEDVETVLRNRYRNVAPYAALARKGATWRRLLRGQIHVRSIAYQIARTMTARVLRRVKLAWRAMLGLSIAGQVATIRRRGGRVHLVSSGNDFGIDEVHAHLGKSPDRLAHKLGRPITVLDGVDHNMSTLGAQDRIFEILRETTAGR